MGGLNRAAAAVCMLIAAADLSQPLLMDWIPKHWGALGGGLFYLTTGALLLRDVRPAAWAVVALPAIPVTVLALWAAGVSVPVQPDGLMVAILVLQLTAAALCAAWLRQRTT